MILARVAPLLRGIALIPLLLVLLDVGTAMGCDAAKSVTEADPVTIRDFFAGQRKQVLTFLGYSGAEYEDKDAMLDQAGRILGRFDPEKTIVNMGATAMGIGAVYALAKDRGFLTTGIVSTQARSDKVPLSSCVDVVFFVKDETWGGFIPGTDRLSPTSTAIVENSDLIVAIGGGEVARDELIAAQRSRKPVEFIPADMHHGLAREKALKKAQPAPTDFAGKAATAIKVVR